MLRVGYARLRGSLEPHTNTVAYSRSRFRPFSARQLRCLPSAFVFSTRSNGSWTYLSFFCAFSSSSLSTRSPSSSPSSSSPDSSSASADSYGSPLLNAQYKLEVPIHARSKIKSVLIQYLKAFVIAVLSMLAGASVVHAIMKPDLQMQAEAAAKAAEKERRRLEARQRNEEALLEQKKQREEAELKAKQQAELKAKPS
jgi:hypothetical protein